MIDRKVMNLRKRMAAGGTCCGVWLGLPSPTVCEILADSGVDFILADAEHSPFNQETQQHMLMAFRGSPTVPIIRVPWNDEVMIKQALDLGWGGVLIPQVNSPEEVRKAVAACRYPPLGKRGWGPRRVANYGRDEEDYKEVGNDSVLCIIQLESVTGADSVGEIVCIPGFDWIFVGRMDMAGSIGKVGENNSPEVWEAVRRIFDTAAGAGIPTGNAIQGMTPDAVQKQLDLGCRVILLGEDCDILRESVEGGVQAFRNVMNSREISITSG